MSGGVPTALAAIVGAPHVITDPDTMAGFCTDWTGRYAGDAVAVVRPRTTAEVVEVVKLCAAAGIGICPQGGNTGLVGGSVPMPGDGPTVLLSTSRMTDVLDVDPVDGCMGVQAGVTVAEIARRADEAGLAFGIDLASRASATAGGIVATNAGGIQVIRYGDTRRQVLGIEAVLADGSVVRRWKRLAKDNVGYDLPGLLAGSEGTLAIITEVLFTLVRPAASRFVAVAAVDGVAVALKLIDALRISGLVLEAAELMTSTGVALVHDAGHRRPTSAEAPCYLLVEVSGPGELDTAIDGAWRTVGGVVEIVGEPAPARALWGLREAHTEAIARSSSTIPIKLDVSVPHSALASALDRIVIVGAEREYPCRTVIFGHVGDGNLHVNLLDVPLAEQDSLTDRVLDIVVDAGGSVSAEHGVGRAKKRWMWTRGEGDRAVMRAIKTALDPTGRLNPGVLW